MLKRRNRTGTPLKPSSIDKHRGPSRCICTSLYCLASLVCLVLVLLPNKQACTEDDEAYYDCYSRHNNGSNQFLKIVFIIKYYYVHADEATTRRSHLEQAGSLEPTLPFGVTMIAKAWRDNWMCEIASRFHQDSGLGCGPAGHGV